MARGTDFGAGRILYDKQRAAPKQMTSLYGQQQNGAAPVRYQNGNARFTVKGLRRYVGPDFPHRRGGYQGAPGTSGNYSATVTGKGPTPGTMRPF